MVRGGHFHCIVATVAKAEQLEKGWKTGDEMIYKAICSKDHTASKGIPNQSQLEGFLVKQSS